MNNIYNDFEEMKIDKPWKNEICDKIILLKYPCNNSDDLENIKFNYIQHHIDNGFKLKNKISTKKENVEPYIFYKKTKTPKEIMPTIQEKATCIRIFWREYSTLKKKNVTKEKKWSISKRRTYEEAMILAEEYIEKHFHS